MTLVAALTRSAWMQVAGQWASPFSLILGVVQPAILTTMLLAARRVGSGYSATAIGIGVGLTALWALSVWSAGGILRSEVWMGTLGRLVIAPTDVRVVVLGKSLGNAALNGLLVTATVTTVLLMSGVVITIEEPFVFVLGLAGAVASAIGLGLALGSAFLMTRAAGRIAEALMYPVFLLGGLLIPSAVLPEWLRWPSDLVSLRWAREVFLAATGETATEPLALVWLWLLAGAYWILGWHLFARILARSRNEGSLELA